jgi:hypothetical protein
MNFRVSSVSRLLVIASVLALSACASGGESVTDGTDVAVTTTFPEPPEVVAGLCDHDPTVEFVSCTNDILVFEESFDGAVERLRTDQTWESDLQYLLLNQEVWDASVAPSLGAAQLVPGYTMALYGFYVPALEGFEDVLTWQQEWAIADGSTLVEQAVYLRSAKDADAALSRWRDAALAAGLVELSGFPAPEGSFTTSYVDPSGTYPARKCAAQTLVTVGPLLLSMTHLSGGDCTRIPAQVPPAVLNGLVPVAERLVP